MSSTDSRIDAYIEKSADFAKPILNYLRALIHETCPEVKEDWKWSFPNFMYRDKILCSMAVFKNHCAFGFWLEKEMKTMKEITKDIEKNSMFNLGKLTKIEDLPSKKQLKAAIKEAMELTEMGVTIKKAAPAKKEIETPDYFSKALNSNKQAKQFFDNASPSFRKEYILWITDAKTEVTRNKRLEQAIEWIAEGKGRNWKYEKC
ncbi:YdeI/OmpD-associated family protein [Chryseobacterium suipulveris]|uniref:YdeI/OmpD-associated family protein n=1 Tax=Chryseobacterium suipulveris TaxID=2929800 RepID=A0ABY4BPF3_9FLAO|nr:YdeI/OmpD-associated family protein [Chryseobacterium suipulveris]UOE41061.1 YdeI/OmpD-associated family protein [Chryseobacterium suipulveris]